jgi:urea carboxylase
MGSKSTFTGAALGGHQGRTLMAGDFLDIIRDTADTIETQTVPTALWPALSSTWEIEVTPGAQWDEEYLSIDSMRALLDSVWSVTPASNRSGLRIEGPRIKWARRNGGEGGSHPSNVLDQGGLGFPLMLIVSGYALGALNINGDTPVLFGVDGPDMGGFACLLVRSPQDVC